MTRQDFSTAAKLSTIAGFQLTGKVAITEMERSERDDNLMVRAASDTFVRKMHRWVYLHQMDPKFARGVVLVKTTLDKGLNSKFLSEQFRSSVRRRIYESPQTVEEVQLNRFFTKIAVDEVTNAGLLDINRWLSPKAVFRNQPVTIPFANRNHIFDTEDKGEDNDKEENE